VVSYFDRTLSMEANDWERIDCFVFAVPGAGVVNSLSAYNTLQREVRCQSLFDHV